MRKYPLLLTALTIVIISLTVSQVSAQARATSERKPAASSSNQVDNTIDQRGSLNDVSDQNNNTGEQFESTTTVAGVMPGNNSTLLLQEMDRTYAELENIEPQLLGINQKVKQNSGSSGKIVSLLTKIEGVEKSCGSIKSVSETFVLIPYLGTVAKGTAMSMDRTSSMLGKIRTGMLPLEAGAKGFTKMGGGLENIQAELAELKGQIYTLKANYTSAASNVAASNDQNKINQFEVFSAEASNELRSIQTSIAELKQFMPVMNEYCNVMHEAGKPISPIESNISKVESQVSKIGNGAHNIDKTLSKQFKKDVKVGVGKLSKTIKIRLSVKDILTGGGAMKKVEKYIKKAGDWAKDQLKPYMSQLSEKVMDKVPGADDAVSSIMKLKSKFDEFKSSSETYINISKKISESKLKFKNKMNLCIGSI